MKTARDVLIYFSIIAKGDWERTMTFLRNRTNLPAPSEMERVVGPYRKKALTIIDDEYPDWIRQLLRPPFVIFYEGDISLLNDQSRIVSILSGPDADNAYAIERTASIVAEAVEGGAIIMAGLSKGAQQAALEAALKKGPAILILCNGLGKAYPADAAELQERARKKGLVISFYEDQEDPSPYHVRERNCFLGQANKLVFLPGCRYHDGSLLSLAIALRLGRDVACLPYRAGDEFLNNQFIFEGASLVESGRDLLYELGLIDQR